jgi:RNA polymerase sigma factor (TIGR02999 family)
MGDITELIQQANAGDADARNRLFAAIYPDLRRIARARLRGHLTDPDLGATALVNEAYLRVYASRRADAPDRARFFAYIATAMRSVIVDFARGRSSQRRGGEVAHAELDDEFEPVGDVAGAAQIIRVHEALGEIGQHDPRLANVVEMRYFGGYEDEEIAQALSLSVRTVRRDWQKARMLLAAALR